MKNSIRTIITSVVIILGLSGCQSKTQDNANNFIMDGYVQEVRLLAQSGAPSAKKAEEDCGSLDVEHIKGLEVAKRRICWEGISTYPEKLEAANMSQAKLPQVLAFKDKREDLAEWIGVTKTWLEKAQETELGQFVTEKANQTVAYIHDAIATEDEKIDTKQ